MSKSRNENIFLQTRMNNNINILFAAVETGNLEQVREILDDPAFEVNINLNALTLDQIDRDTVLRKACSKQLQ